MKWMASFGCCMVANVALFFFALMQWLVDGVTAATITGAAACLARNHDILKNYLSLFLRDDLISFQSTKMIGLSDPDQQVLEVNLRERISTNVRYISKRIHNMMPSQQPTDKDKVELYLVSVL